MNILRKKYIFSGIASKQKIESTTKMVQFLLTKSTNAIPKRLAEL
jgi:hypothetical protein